MKYLLPMVAALAVVSTAAAAPNAFAYESCSKQAASIETARQAALELKAERNAVVPELEAAGDAWEDAQTVRNFSADHAMRADQAKVAYDASKSKLRSIEAELQEAVANVNERVSVYNRHCASD
ncbi:hypothetical protein [Henriciella marina]|uniref:hypothetical protein n=1 Tax=Henriciella marina TaxID=453851 RepID=UPI0012EA0EED|nr:hypothetical protein [Henriciella marina]